MSFTKIWINSTTKCLITYSLYCDTYIVLQSKYSNFDDILLIFYILQSVFDYVEIFRQACNQIIINEKQFTLI